MTTKGEWKKFTGSDEQIAEIKESENGVLFHYVAGLGIDKTPMYYQRDRYHIDNRLANKAIYKYLICNPHPLADMICQWAMTGQPVWVKEREMKKTGFPLGYKYYATTTPDWNIPNAEYSFTAFEE